MNIAKELTKSEYILIFLQNPEGYKLEYALGKQAEELIGTALIPGKGLPGWIILHNQILNEINVSRDIRFDFNNIFSMKLLPYSVLGIPIENESNIIGSVLFYNKSLHRKYIESDMEIAKMITSVFELENNLKDNTPEEVQSAFTENRDKVDNSFQKVIKTIAGENNKNGSGKTNSIVNKVPTISDKAMVQKMKILYGNILNTFSIPILIVDKNLNLIFINRSFIEMFNMSEEQLTMKCIKDVLDFRTENNDNLWDKIKLDIFNLDQYEPVKKVHFVYRRDDINYFKYMVVSCILKEREKIIGKLIEFSPVPTNRELQAKEEEFIQNVSHELRTPLSAILGSIQILMSGVGENSALGETERKFLSIIKEEGEKFSLILDNIININKISTGEVSTIRNEEINLCDVIEDAALQFKEKAKSKNIKINIELSDKLGSIKGDKMSLFYVFSQLIDNGIKFNKENGEVFISSPGLIIFDNIWQAQITIKDTGIGIDKKDIPHIFDKFYRVENKVHTEHGTGLGLATVKDIIMNHNGMINCKSELGEWTEFKILIPAESML